MVSWQWPWSKKGLVQGPKSVNIFLGFFFLVNFCVGTGFLGIPYSFFYAGYLAAIPTFLLIAFASWNAGRWEIEVMARAQAIESFNQSQETSDSEDEDDTGTVISEESVDIDQKSTGHPNFEIILTRKFEISELCEIFFNRWAKYLYMLVVTLNGFLACWSYSAVFGSAWASNIPLNFGTLHECSHDAFHHRLLPTGTPELDSCRNAYYFCLFLFSLIVIPLSLLELKEQAIIQMCLAVLRFTTVAIIIIYCIVKIAEVGDICGQTENETQINTSSLLNDTQYYSNTSILVQSVTIHDIIFKFDWRGWLIAMPVITYAFNVHMGIPSLTHPIKQKQYLRWLILFTFGSIGFAYLSLGIVVPLWFRATIQETITLNWSRFTGPGNPGALRALSYYLILFPSLDTLSAFPLVLQAATNNIYCLLTGRDTSEEAKHRYDWLLLLLLRLSFAIVSILAAFGIANLVQVLKYGGLIGFCILLFPAFLHFQSIRVCKKLFVAVVATKKESFPMSKVTPESGASSDDGKVKGKGFQPESGTEAAPLLSVQDQAALKKSSLYMTPYSNRILSHPIAVVVIGTIIALLTLLAVISLFVHPQKLTCTSTQ